MTSHMDGPFTHLLSLSLLVIEVGFILRGKGIATWPTSNDQGSFRSCKKALDYVKTSRQEEAAL